MNRIILGMAVANYVLVAITTVLGLASGTPRGANVIADDAFGLHFRMGILTALFSMLAHCIVFTYFLGTCRWVKETSAAYRLGAAFTVTSAQCRRRAVLAVVASIALVVATIASGAGAHTRIWPVWIHDIVPAGSYIFMAAAYAIEIAAIERHTVLTDEIMNAVEAVRLSRKTNAAIQAAIPPTVVALP